jgi:hypothetical protein
MKQFQTFNRSDIWEDNEQLIVSLVDSRRLKILDIVYDRVLAFRSSRRLIYSSFTPVIYFTNENSADIQD